MPSNMPAAVGEIRMVLSNLPTQYNYMQEALPMPREGTPLQHEEVEVLSRRRARWAELRSSFGTEIRATCTIYSNVSHSTLAVRGSVQWPRLVEAPMVVFPKVQQGHEALAYVKVKNHGSKPVLLQLVDQSAENIESYFEARPHSDANEDAKMEVTSCPCPYPIDATS